LCKNSYHIQALDLVGYALFVDRISNKILGKFNKILIGPFQLIYYKTSAPGTIFGHMKAVLQRVSHASVTVDNLTTGTIKKGLLVLVGIEDADTAEDIQWLSNKIVQLRIFDDENKVPNISVKDIGGDILLVSQFTLHASTKKGNRPSYIKASKPDFAIPMYEMMIAQLENDLGKKIATGIFGADMKVELLNDGPVTIVIDTKDKE